MVTAWRAVTLDNRGVMGGGEAGDGVPVGEGERGRGRMDVVVVGMVMVK